MISNYFVQILSFANYFLDNRILSKNLLTDKINLEIYLGDIPQLALDLYQHLITDMKTYRGSHSGQLPSRMIRLKLKIRNAIYPAHLESFWFILGSIFALHFVGIKQSFNSFNSLTMSSER